MTVIDQAQRLHDAAARRGYPWIDAEVTAEVTTAPELKIASSCSWSARLLAQVVMEGAEDDVHVSAYGRSPEEAVNHALKQLGWSA